MRFEYDGITLWYGTTDAPAPENIVSNDNEILLNIGVQPLDASNRVEVRYRINQGTVQTIPAKILRSEPYRQVQYFRAYLPALSSGDRVEYTVICRCAGRQVPNPKNTEQWSSFTVASDNDSDLVTETSSAQLTLNQKPISNTRISTTPTLVQNPSFEPEFEKESDLFITKEIIGQLIDDQTNETISGYSIRGSIERNGQRESLGYDIANGRGYFSFTYALPESESGRLPSRLFLEILNSDEEEITQTTVTIPTNPEQIIKIPVAVPIAPEQPSPALTQVANLARLQLPSQLLTTLTNKGIRTLVDLQKAGGINNIPELGSNSNNPNLQKLEAQANLSLISDDLQLNNALIERGFTSISRIAQATRADFVSAIGEQQGDFKAAQLQVKARAQTNFLNNIAASVGADLANGLPNPLTDDSESSKDVFKPTCSCQSCEAATSPVAYLADLLDFSISKVKNNNTAITFEYLANIFHQPFGELPASCEIQQQPERQVRLCIEVLRSYLSANPPNTTAAAVLEQAEKQYLLNAYQILLNQIGTSYDELRQTRGNNEEQEALAKRLGIALDKLNLLFLDPNGEVTEATLERIFGFKATTGFGKKQGDPLNQVVSWQFQGVELGQNTDPNGYVYLNLELSRGIIEYTWTVTVFRDSERTQLVARGSSPRSDSPPTSLVGNPADRYQGTIELNAINNSGLMGTVTLDYRIDSNDITIFLGDESQGLLSWRLEYLKILWQEQDWSEDLPEKTPPIIDPDLIGLAYLTNWSNPDDPAYQLWQARTAWIEQELNTLKAYTQDANGLDELFAAIASNLGIPLTNNIVELYEDREKGNDISSTLDNLNLSNGGFLYLVRVRNLLASDNPVLISEWEEVYNIFLQALKIGQFKTWREQERDDRVILSPESFQIPVAPPLEFPPPEPQPLPQWRATQQALRTWEDRLQSRIDREQTIKEGLQTAISATEEATLTLLRDALIMAMDIEGDNLNTKADWITKNLLIDAQAGSCQETTRIAQAIETIQSLLWGLKINQFREIYPDLELSDRENFDEIWKWLGSYANWRSAMFVFLYPENILRPELRKYQTPAFRQLVKNVRNNRRLSPDRACLEAKAYSDYFADIATLKLEATCQTRTRIHSGDCRDRTATTYSNLFHMFARGGKTNTVYWSTYNSGDRSNYSQSFWTPLPAIEKAINIIGAVPYAISSQERYIYLFVRTQKADVQELVYFRYDLEQGDGNWDSEPKPLNPSEEATRFTAVAKQNIIETDPPHLAIRLDNSTIYARQLNRAGDDWEGGDWNPLISPDESTLYSKICSMVEIARGQWYLVVQRTNRRIACKLFGSNSPSNWLNIGNVNSSFRGAFSFPRDRTYDMYVYWKERQNIRYQAIKNSPSQRQTISSLSELNNWLSSNANVNLAEWNTSRLDDTFVPEEYIDKNLFMIFSYKQSNDPLKFAHATVKENLINSLLKYSEWQRASRLFQTSNVENISLSFALRDFTLCEYNNVGSNENNPTPPCPKIELNSFLERSEVFQLQIGDIFIAPTFTHFIERVISRNPLINSNINRNSETSIPNPFEWNVKQFAYQQISGKIGLYRCTFNRSNDDSLSIVSPKRIAPRINGNLNISEQISEAELHTRREEIRNVYEDNPRISQTNRAYLDEAFYFVPIFIALKLQQQRYYQPALNYYRTVYAYNLTIDNSQPTDPKDQTKIYYGLKLEESLPEVYQRAEDWLLDPLNPHLIASTRRNTYTRFTLISIIRCFLEYADNEFTRDTAESVPRARTLYLNALELFDRLEQQARNCQQLIDSLDTEISNQLKINTPELLPVWHQIKRSLLEIKDEEILNNVVQQIETVLTGEQPWITKLINAQTIIDLALNSLPPAPNFQQLLEQKDRQSERIYASLSTQTEVSNALKKVGDIASKDYLDAISIVSGITTQALEKEKIPLPWLRQKTMATAANNGSVTSTQPLIREDYQRLAQYNPIAPSHIATLAQIAKTYPLQAVQIVQTQPNTFLPSPNYGFCIPLNPVLDSLHLWAKLNLYKLRTCRNIAGIERKLEPYAAPTDILSGLPQIGAGGQLILPGSISFPATPYRYAVIIERAKQLVSIAQQIEASFLSALEKLDAELYNLLKARQDIQLTRAGVRLQDLRVREAESGVTLAELQRERSQIQVDHYQNLLEDPINAKETASLVLLGTAAYLYGSAGVIYAAGSLKELGKASISFGLWGNPEDKIASALSSFASAASTTASLLSQWASYERRTQEWEFQEKLAQQDVRIGTQQIRIAQDKVRVAGQERVISQMQADFAEETLDFLSTKFSSAEFYDWMVGILEGVYSFFLQQATATAKLAEAQLAFERQQVPPAYIQADYWEIPNDNLGGASQDNNTTDRRGITGSARLLQDIYQLDQYAFETDQRKLQLTKTISLARLAPAEFQGFRETGDMSFSTPMELFDRDFPGHYLRLIKRVRTSIIALIPPNEGIKATLSTTGVSRVVIGQNNLFQTNDIARPPESVALTSPRDATGLFELTPQSQEMLLPFENLGVDTSWELRLPKASNLFDYSTIADVLITIEYTALNSFTYRQTILDELGDTFSGDRPFSFRNQFADAWYDLNNPEQTDNPMEVTFETTREDFPANIEELKIQELVLYFARSQGETFEVPVEHLNFTYINQRREETTIEGNDGNTIDGTISTRRGNAPSGWISMIGKTPVGKWELALPNTDTSKILFEEEAIEDILFVITYSGRIAKY